MVIQNQAVKIENDKIFVSNKEVIILQTNRKAIIPEGHTLKYDDICGVYFIINKIDGKFYIGSSVNFWERMRSHFAALKKKHGINVNLQNAYNSYGKENFIFAIVELTTRENIDQIEQKYLDLYWDNQINCYNVNKKICKRLSDITRISTNKKLVSLNVDSGLYAWTRDYLSKEDQAFSRWVYLEMLKLSCSVALLSGSNK